MRIIDKNTDFYDYFQNVYRDGSVTFDRRDSFVVTKEMMCQNLTSPRRWWYIEDMGHCDLVLLQICNTFWLFLAEIKKYDEYDIPEDYRIELLTKWRNYDKPRTLVALDVIKLGYNYYDFQTHYDRKDIITRVDKIVKMIDTNDYTIISRINRHTVYSGNKREERHIPLLKACGIAQCVNAQDVYLAFEEYFSLEKQAAERRDPVGTTDVDRLESHGFDKKTSFRGKRK